MAAAQRWEIGGSGNGGGRLLVQTGTTKCLARISISDVASIAAPRGAGVAAGRTAVGVVVCDPDSSAQAWDIGAANVTVAQVHDAADPSSCLTFNSSSLHMEVGKAPATEPNLPGPVCRAGGFIYFIVIIIIIIIIWGGSSCDRSNAADLFRILQACRKETGDKTTPNPSGCRDGNCRFSGIVDQLWYLNSLGQLSSAITNIENGANQLLPMIPGFAANTPWCLTSSPNSTPPPPPPPPPPAVDATMPLQVTRSESRAPQDPLER